VKRLLILFAILALAFLAIPAFATEAQWPPGITAAPIDFDAFLSPVAVQVPKEFNAVGFEAVLVSTYAVIDVAPGFPRPVIVSAVAAVPSNVEPMLAGLMYGARLNVGMDNAAEVYLMPIVDTRPSLGSVA
jgi:hypothetical protein